jgi:hypothetical protein
MDAATLVTRWHASHLRVSPDAQEAPCRACYPNLVRFPLACYQNWDGNRMQMLDVVSYSFRNFNIYTGQYYRLTSWLIPPDSMKFDGVNPLLTISWMKRLHSIPLLNTAWDRVPREMKNSKRRNL